MKNRNPKKPQSLSALKKKLDKIFSLWVRLRDTQGGGGNCYTCNKPLTYKQGHAGHFISRNYLITRWDPRNVKLQCPGCNLFGGGKPLDFEERLKREIGEKEVEDMKRSRHKVFKVDVGWYLEQIALYKEKVEKLSP